MQRLRELQEEWVRISPGSSGKPKASSWPAALSIHSIALSARICAEAIGGGPTGNTIKGRIEDVLEGADVVIDFTNAASSLEHLRRASAYCRPMVIGATGFTREQLDEAAELARQIPCVISPNMSIGVNILFKMVAEAARLLGDGYDVEIVEAHHRFKKDAPSGTAIKLAQLVAQALDRDLGRSESMRATG